MPSKRGSRAELALIPDTHAARAVYAIGYGSKEISLWVLIVQRETLPILGWRGNARVLRPPWSSARDVVASDLRSFERTEVFLTLLLQPELTALPCLDFKGRSTKWNEEVGRCVLYELTACRQIRSRTHAEIELQNQIHFLVRTIISDFAEKTCEVRRVRRSAAGLGSRCGWRKRSCAGAASISRRSITGVSARM